MSQKWIVLLIVICILAGLVIAIPYFIDVNRYRGAIEARISDAINRKVTLAELHLSLFPLALESKNVRIHDDPAFGSNDFISVEKFLIHVEFRPLLQSRIQVNSLDLVAPQVRLIRNARGVWNFSSLLGKSQKTPANSEQSKDPSPSAAIHSFNVEELNLSNGRVTIIDELRPNEAQTYDIQKFTARNISAASEMPFLLAVLLPGVKEPVRLEGHAGPLNPDNMADSPARGTLTAKAYRAGPVALQNIIGQFQLKDGTLTVKPIDFDLYSGKQSGMVVLNYLDPKPSIALNTKLSRIDVNQFLSSTGSTANLLLGLVDGNISVKTSGENEQQILRNLVGKAAVELQKGKLTHINIGRQIAMVGQLAGIPFLEKDTPIQRASAHFEIADNWARTQDLQIETPDLALSGQGGFSFDGAMNFNALATFSQEMSQSMQKSSSVGGLLNAVFQNQSKQVTIPLLISGTFQAPHFKLDTDKMLAARMGSTEGAGQNNLQNTLRSLGDLFKKKKK
jgi:AsmA protein